MLKIRLQRVGKKGQAHFRVVVLEHTTKTKGKYLELLGSYNPHQKVFKVKKERVEHWLSNGAQMSPTVNNLMVNYKIMDIEKVQSWKPKKNPKKTEAKEAEKKSAENTSETPKPKTDTPAETQSTPKAETTEPEVKAPAEPQDTQSPTEPAPATQ